MNRGFIQIPIIIAIVVGLAAAGTSGYFGITKYVETKQDREGALENRIAELESRLSQNATTTIATSTDKRIEEKGREEGAEEVVEKTPQAPVPSPSSVPVVPPQVVETPEDFRAECSIAETVVDQDGYITAEIKIFFERASEYEITWSNNPTREPGHGEARFKFSTPGERYIQATITRKTDGYTKRVDCPRVTVECSEYSCLSLEAKQILALNNIIDEVDTWYDGSYAPLGPVNKCLISESVIRVYEYQYTVTLGGVGIPEFSMAEDCSNSVAPKAYQAKIQLLKDNL